MAQYRFDYPTPAQLRYIALLSSKLKMGEPAIGSRREATLMILELKEELRHRNELAKIRKLGGKK